MTHRVLVVKTSRELFPGFTRKAPFPPEGIDTGEYWKVANIGEQLLSARYDVILVSPRAWSTIQNDEKAAEWFQMEPCLRLDPGGVMVWLWEDE